MHGEIFALEVNSNDDIDDFLNLANISWSQAIVPCNE
jgi:hypothetical protein